MPAPGVTIFDSNGNTISASGGALSVTATVGTGVQAPQATTNVADTNAWTILATNRTVTTIPEVFVDTTAPQPTQRFYRAVPR